MGGMRYDQKKWLQAPFSLDMPIVQKHFGGYAYCTTSDKNRGSLRDVYSEVNEFLTLRIIMYEVHCVSIQHKVWCCW